MYNPPDKEDSGIQRANSIPCFNLTWINISVKIVNINAIIDDTNFALNAGDIAYLAIVTGGIQSSTLASHTVCITASGTPDTVEDDFSLNASQIVWLDYGETLYAAITLVGGGTCELDDDGSSISIVEI